jgi:hypothetical protein
LSLEVAGGKRTLQLVQQKENGCFRPGPPAAIPLVAAAARAMPL